MGFGQSYIFQQEKKVIEIYERHKITWRMIMTDFKQRHPRLGKEVSYWCPHDYATILIYLKDGMKLTYNYDEHRAYILSTRWKEE